MSGRDRADPVGDPGTRGQHGEAGVPRQACRCLRREHRRLLVPDVQDRHRRVGLDRAVVDGEDVTAGQGENRPRAVRPGGGHSLGAAVVNCLLLRSHGATLPGICRGSGSATAANPAPRNRCDDGVVPTMNDLARQAHIGPPDLDWLHALVSDWELLADLSFADLTLWAPLATEHSWIALAQVRPTTGPTALPEDIVGAVRPAHRQQLLATAMTEGRICREGDPE